MPDRIVLESQIAGLTKHTNSRVSSFSALNRDCVSILSLYFYDNPLKQWLVYIPPAHNSQGVSVSHDPQNKRHWPGGP